MSDVASDTQAPSAADRGGRSRARGGRIAGGASGAATAVEPPAPLKQTPLHSLHVSRGARMAPFAGYDMPVQYASGIIAEHNHVRSAAGLFDVSHMGQAFLVGADHETVARALETLVPGDIVGLAPGRQRYTQLTAEDGGILDDLMVTRSVDPEEDGVLMLVVNAGTKDADYAHIEARLPAGIRLLRADHRALVAVQGPMAVQAVGAALRRGGGAAVHERDHDALRRYRLPHQPLGLHRRGRLRDFLQGDADARDRRAAPLRANREADRARRARLVAA